MLLFSKISKVSKVSGIYEQGQARDFAIWHMEGTSPKCCYFLQIQQIQKLAGGWRPANAAMFNKLNKLDIFWHL